MSIRDPLGFFDRTTTRRFIEEFSQARNVTIFVGAGASIDRGSPDWAELATRLLAEMTATRPDMGTGNTEANPLFDLLRSSFEPAQIGSMVREQYRLRYPEAMADNHLGNRIFQILYDDWQPRQSIATNVASLALLMTSNGQRVHILTTNYDDNIEMSCIDPTRVPASGQPELNELGEFAKQNNLKFQHFTGPPRRNLSRRIIPVTHLNGFIGQSGNREGKIVFSEEDFTLFDDRERSREPDSSYLERRFSESTVLFVGTSMRDIHVLRALTRSRGSSAKRYAIMPAQQYYTPGRDVAVVDELLSLSTTRLRHLGVVAVTPDYFGQVSQLLNEIANAAGDPASYLAVAYHKRLRDWWVAWSSSKHPMIERQRYHQARLSSCIEELFSEGLLPEGSQARLELWIRSEPDERKIELWANSETVTIRPGTSHVATIGLESSYFQVEALLHRQIRSGPMPRSNSRWQRYIASPVLLPDSWLELPVGVVCILVRHLDKPNQALPETAILERVVTAARELLTP